MNPVSSAQAEKTMYSIVSQPIGFFKRVWIKVESLINPGFLLLMANTVRDGSFLTLAPRNIQLEEEQTRINTQVSSVYGVVTLESERERLDEGQNLRLLEELPSQMVPTAHQIVEHVREEFLSKIPKNLRKKLDKAFFQLVKSKLRAYDVKLPLLLAVLTLVQVSSGGMPYILWGCPTFPHGAWINLGIIEGLDLSLRLMVCAYMVLGPAMMNLTKGGVWRIFVRFMNLSQQALNAFNSISQSEESANTSHLQNGIGMNEETVVSISITGSSLPTSSQRKMLSRSREINDLVQKYKNKTLFAMICGDECSMRLLELLYFRSDLLPKEVRLPWNNFVATYERYGCLSTSPIVYAIFQIIGGLLAASITPWYRQVCERDPSSFRYLYTLAWTIENWVLGMGIMGGAVRARYRIFKSLQIFLRTMDEQSRIGNF